MKRREIIKPNAVVLLGGGVLLVGAFGIGAFYALGRSAVEKFPAHFYIGEFNVSGRSVAQARAQIAQYADMVRSAQATVVVQGMAAPYKMPLVVRDQQLVGVDVNETIAAAKRIAGRDRVVRAVKGWFGMSATVQVPVEVTTNERVVALADELVKRWNVPLRLPRDAEFILTGGGGEDYGVQVTAAQSGEYVNVPELMENVTHEIQSGKQTPFTVRARVVQAEPRVSTRDAESLADDALAFLRRVQPRILLSGDKKITVTAAQLMHAVQPRIQDEDAVVTLDRDKVKLALAEIMRQFEDDGRDAKFVRDGNRVTTFVPHKESVLVDWDALTATLNASFGNASSTFALPMKIVQPAVTLDKTNDLGIGAELGRGASNFSGSPAKRRHNIAIGLKSLNGLLIAPGETLSLITALGTIDASTGYVQELVIKENKTTPEFGGGLCQIGTTTFRAAMGAGFPIVERRNHSFQVRYYYENGLSGTDATIYQPKPDLRFTNDTGYHAMLETRMKGDTLTFIFWGTPDGRVASRTPVKVLSTSPAPAKKEIETTEIPVGTVKCTEQAHPGASTIFSYSVTYPDGAVKKQDFPSYYKPWGAVCLIGVTATSTPTVGVAEAAQALNPDAAGATGN